MKQLKTLFLASLVLGFTALSMAQEVQGIATYKSHQKIDIKLDSTSANSAMNKQIQDMLKKQFQKTYVLEFDRGKSIYKEEESLAAPKAGNMGVISSFMGGGSDVLFKDTSKSNYTSQKEFMGKIFLIKDTLPSYEWKLENETKNIGEYTCFKATFTKIVKVPKQEDFSFSEMEKEEDIEMIDKEFTTTAWYTPQIPISNGPDMYQGLPGLILEINDGTTTLICSNIVLNPSKKLSINPPAKGKKVSKEAYNEITSKKLKEMQEMYSPSRNENKGGEVIQIRIGG